MLGKSKMAAAQITKLACLWFQFSNRIVVSIVRFLMVNIEYLNDYSSRVTFIIDVL